MSTIDVAMEAKSGELCMAPPRKPMTISLSLQQEIQFIVRSLLALTKMTFRTSSLLPLLGLVGCSSATGHRHMILWFEVFAMPNLASQTLDCRGADRTTAVAYHLELVSHSLKCCDRIPVCSVSICSQHNASKAILEDERGTEGRANGSSCEFPAND